MFVTLGIQHAMRMRRIVLSFVDCLAVQYSSSLSLKQHDLKKKFLDIKYVLFSLQFVSEKFLILRRYKPHIIKNIQGEHKSFPDYKHLLQDHC